MCRSERLTLCLAFFFACLKLNAETLPAKYLSFDLLTIDDGLSQGMVNTIVQDHFGFMWFGTKDGLNRYDGYHFVVYRHNPSDTNSLADNFIQQLFEDSRGWLWVGTSDHGVDLFNRETETFYHFRHSDIDENSLGDDRIECITEDHNGAIWITTENGLNKISVEENTANRGKVFFRIQRYFSGYVRAYMASDGMLWGSSIGNFSFRIHPEKNNHDRIDTLDNSKYFSYPIIDRGFEKFIGAAVEDTFHHILFLISEYSIATVNMLNNNAEIISTQRNHWGQFGRTLCIDDSQKIWMSERDWLEQFDVRQRKWYRILPRDHNLDILLDNTSVAYKDQSGIIWVGTKGYGVLKFNPQSEKFHKTDDESIGWMSPTADGRVIITKFGKLINIFSPKTGDYTISISDSSFFTKAKSSADFGISTAAVQDKNGLFWLSKNCLVSYDEKTNEFQRYRQTDLYNFPVFVDHDNKIWTGTADVLSCFDPISKTFADYQYPVRPLRFPYDFLQCMYEDSSGIFWLGTAKGLLRFDPRAQSWRQFKNILNDSTSLSYDLIFSLCPDPVQPQKYLWIGTNGGGLNRFDMESGKVIRYDQKNGLPNDVVYGILSDDQNNLWLSTNYGLSRFNPQTNTFKNFQEKDGLQGNEFNRYAYCKTNDGTLYFGGLNGFNYFQPKDLTDNPFVPQIVITDFKLRNQSVSAKEKNSPLRKPAFLTDEIVLPYSENMISFEFASMDFTSPGQNLYRYRLSGFDHDWIQAGNVHVATYTNLNPGTYTFTVLGSSSDGIWNEKGKSIQLIILPPWYMTWWFRIAVALAAIGLLYGFYRATSRTT